MANSNDAVADSKSPTRQALPSETSQGLDSLLAKLSACRVLPVLTVEDAAAAVPLARALAAGGLRVLEVTLRTAAALAAIEQISRQVPDVVVGAGTITEPQHLKQALAAGATFAVSPGLTPALAEAAAAEPELPLIPGVMTPSEAMIAREAGFRFLKLFPAQPAGGVALLRSLGGPLADLRFCPTGGIDASNFRSFLDLPNVVCVGGSWVAPPAAIAAGDWAAVTRLAQEVFS